MKGLLFSALILFLATCPMAYAQDAVEYFNQGNMAYREGKYDEAVESFKKALELNPTDASSHFGLGNSYFLKRNYEKAITHYKEVIKLRPDYAKVHYALGLAYKRVGKDAEAEKAFDTYNRLSATKPEEEVKERPVVKKEEKAPERKVPE
ncbi:MAG TPA: tetratricopeptide repeat protein, partial [Candidatus Hypogeohydataceae bacterium YC38]